MIPVWAQGLGVFALLMASASVGVYLNDRKPREHSRDETYLLSSALGLLALLIGFTFSLGLERYEERRELVLAEANAIGTYYLRLDLLPQAPRKDLKTLTQQYIEVRRGLAQAGEDTTAIATIETQTNDLSRQLWDKTLAALPLIETPTLTPLLVSALNETIDLAEARKSALDARLPQSVLWVLILYAAISAGIIGYVGGGLRWRTYVSTSILLILLSLAITLILDLDRPRAGSITISQLPLIDLQKSIAEP